jgi:hypothetical protein
MRPRSPVGPSSRRPATSVHAEARLRKLLNHWDHQTSPAAIVSLGEAGLQRLLDSLEGQLDLWTGRGELEGREYDDARHAALGAFAQADLGAVLRAIQARGWDDVRVALSGVGRVPDARVVPYLLRACASKEPLHRLAAMSGLAVQRDESATSALIDALRDRSSNVRSAAVDALGQAGDPRAIEPLELFAKRSARAPWLARSAKNAIRRIRSVAGRTAKGRRS